MWKITIAFPPIRWYNEATIKKGTAQPDREKEMTRQEKLIAFYESRLEKVEEMYKDDSRKAEYIEFAKKELEEVKNGRQW